MRNILALAVVAALALSLSAVIAGQAAKAGSETYSGWIVCECCGEKNANAEGKECVLSCAKGGAKLALYVPETKTLMPLDDQKKATEFVGAMVKVTGSKDGKTLKITSIETVKKS